jgi:type I restriction enzyme M protein
MDFKTERDVEVKLLHPLFSDTLGYPEDQLDWARRVPMNLGRQVLNKEADLVAKFRDQPVITVEAKSPNEAIQSGLGQLDSYAFHLRTPYSVITNGKRFVLRGYYSFNSRINVIDDAVDALAKTKWKTLRKLISFENIPATIQERPNPLVVPDEEKIKDYRRFFRKIHNAIRDRDKLDPTAAFDELSKLLFLKAAEDEWRTKAKSKPVLTPEKIEEWESLGRGKAKGFINEWFQAATEELFPGVFEDHPQINLSSGTLAAVLRDMKPFHIRNGDVDVKGRAFEEFLPSQLRGEGLGQFFTPRPIVNFMADLAEISIHDVVADFACGSGGFLIKAFEQMQRGVDELPSGTLRRMGTTRAEILEDIRTRQIFGIDAEPRAAKTAKMNMIMWGDGKNVARGNALDTKDITGKAYLPSEYSEKNQGSGVTLILANPPFGSKEKDAEILKQFVLGSKLQEKKSEKTEILFIEKGLKLLRPEGKMLIVLPQGIMSGQLNQRVRNFIHSEAEIRAIISLPTHAFVQSGVPTVNTCVVYIQKFTKQKKELYDAKTKGISDTEIRELLRTYPDFDYQIFMGSAEFIGYEPSGRMIVEQGEKTDLDLLLEDFANQSEIARPDVDLFDFANRFYGDKSFRRKDQTIRGTIKGLKTAFVVRFSETEGRLDPPFYLWRSQAGPLLAAPSPLGNTIEAASESFSPKTDDDLDREYRMISVSSDGKITLNEYVRGESFTPNYRPKKVRYNDFVYNQMRVNIGSIGLVPKELDGSLASPAYVVFRSKKMKPDFLLNLLRSPFYRMYIDVVSTGSIRDRLYFRDLQKMRVPEVDLAEQSVVSEIVRRTDEELQRLQDDGSAQKAVATSRLHSLIDAAGALRFDQENLEATFAAFANQWRRETAMFSSISKKVKHPAYRKIIAMGDAAVPLILRELRDHPAYWFGALKAITHTSPVGRGEHFNLEQATVAWLDRGRQRGFLD